MRLIGRRSNEIETVFVVCTARPQTIMRQIAALGGLGPYRFVRRPTVTMHDRYFDLPGRALARAGIVLRLRRVRSRYLLTLKAKKRVVRSRIGRYELELAWSRSALARIIRALARLGVVMPQPVIRRGRGPDSVLREAGFSLVQSRTNRRRLRNVARANDPARAVLAELALDTVSFRFSKRRVRFAEVEIELKSRADSTVISAIAALLLDRYAGQLRPWPYGKFATGCLFERLAEQGKLERLLGREDYPVPAAYPMLARRLMGSDIGR